MEEEEDVACVVEGDMGSQEDAMMEREGSRLLLEEGEDEGGGGEEGGEGSRVREEEEGRKKKRLFRFHARHDSLLLNEVLRRNPYTRGYGKTMTCWVEIAEALRAKGLNVQGRACQKRVFNLVDTYRKRECVGFVSLLARRKVGARTEGSFER